MSCARQGDVQGAGCSRNGDLKGQLGANDSFKSSGLGGFGKSYGTTQVFVVGESEGWHSQFHGARDQLLGVRGTVEQ